MEIAPLLDKHENEIVTNDEADHFKDNDDLDSENLANQLTRDDIKQLVDEIKGIRVDIDSLNDLFVRRLFEDKQKSGLIQKLDELSSFSLIEPFIYDLILLLDRVERVEGDFADSVAEELIEILRRRNVEKICVDDAFDPSVHKVVKTVEDSNVERSEIIGIVRNGYVFGGKVIRPTEVVLAKQVNPIDKHVEEKGMGND